MPRRRASWPSGWQENPVTMATLGFTACPIGTHSRLKVS